MHVAVRAVVVAAFALASPSAGAAQSGDALLASAASFAGLTSYAVPVHFTVHVHKPIGMRVGVDGTAYFRAPGDAALEITRAPAIIGGAFKGNYQLDVVPQAWPAKYHVVSVDRDAGAGPPVDVLTAVPRSPGDVTRVVFTLGGPGDAPTGATWTYGDGSTIVLTFVNQRIARFTLPASGSIAVALPSYHLEADVTYGDYRFNTPLPENAFVPTK